MHGPLSQGHVVKIVRDEQGNVRLLALGEAEEADVTLVLSPACAKAIAEGIAARIT